MALEPGVSETADTLGRLKKEFLEGGGDEDTYQDLFTGKGVPAEAKVLHSLHDDGYVGWLDGVLEDQSFGPGAFIEYEVLERNGATAGMAIGRVMEHRRTRSQDSLKVWHLAAADPEYNRWALVELNAEGSTLLHLCRKYTPEKGCAYVPVSTKIAWCHVRRWRMVTVEMMLTIDYAAEVVPQAMNLSLAQYKKQRLLEEERAAAAANALNIPPGGRGFERETPEEIEAKRRDKVAPLGEADAAGRFGGVVQEKKKRGEGPARDLATQATRALGAGEPRMFGDHPKATDAKTVTSRVKSGGQPTAPRDWKDEISALGVSETEADRRTPPRGGDDPRRRGGGIPPGGGRGGGRDGDDPGKGHSGRRDGRSPDPPRKVRASLVVPQKEKRRRPGRDDPDPS